MNNIFYGIEAVVDASGCDITKFTRESLNSFVIQLCKKIDMTPALDMFYWDELNGGTCDDPHLKGISAFRFIETSNITIHTLTLIKAVFINVFSCKTFNPEDLDSFVKEYFQAQKVKSTVIERRYENS